MKHQNIFNRLRRIEGQIRGIEEMVAKDKADQDILIQLQAVKSSVSSTISTLIESLLHKDESGKVVLEEKELDLILRNLKN